MKTLHHLSHFPTELPSFSNDFFGGFNLFFIDRFLLIYSLIGNSLDRGLECFITLKCHQNLDDRYFAIKFAAR